MDILKQIFPHAFQAKDKNALITTLIIYALIFVVCSLLIVILSKIPVVCWLCGILGSALDAYAAGGVVLAILVYLKKIQ